MPRLSVISLGWLVSWLLTAHEMRLAAGSFLPIASAHRLIAPLFVRWTRCNNPISSSIVVVAVVVGDDCRNSSSCCC